jgi:hypothetical protein
LEKVPKSPGERRDNLILSLHYRLEDPTEEENANRIRTYKVATAVLHYYLQGMKDGFHVVHAPPVGIASGKRKHPHREKYAKMNKIQKCAHTYTESGNLHRLQDIKVAGTIVNDKALQNRTCFSEFFDNFTPLTVSERHCSQLPAETQFEASYQSSQAEQELYIPQRTRKSPGIMYDRSAGDTRSTCGSGSQNTLSLSHLDTLPQLENQVLGA